ncbi:MAG: hypothetical protein Q9220_005265 [cf. Caloplaca sp. 1 TL-2023]
MTLDMLHANGSLEPEIGIAARTYASELSSIVATGLLSYCALVPGCARSDQCSIALLSNTNNHLSGRGIVRCWDQICDSYVASINPDFGGLGMILSYLIQTSIAVLGFMTIAVYQIIQLYRSGSAISTPPRKVQCDQSRSPSNTTSSEFQDKISPHLRNFHRFLSEFHKLQCYYSITLQIASFIALHGPQSARRSIKNPFDESFLLLVSTNGIVPVATTFYTLHLCRELTIYHVLLTSLSAIFASYTGIEIVSLLLKPFISSKFPDSGWPAATGGLAPEAVCGRKYQIKYPKKLRPEKVFLVGLASCDLIIIGLMVCRLAPFLRKLFQFLRRSSQRRHPFLIMPPPKFKIITGLTSRTVHVGVGSILTWCAAIEFFFYYQILVPQYDRIVNFDDWGFG